MRTASASSLNESPSEKEGKWHRFFLEFEHSLKALNESPSEKEGKSCGRGSRSSSTLPLNESPSEKEGKYRLGYPVDGFGGPQ